MRDRPLKAFSQVFLQILFDEGRGSRLCWVYKKLNVNETEFLPCFLCGPLRMSEVKDLQVSGRGGRSLGYKGTSLMRPPPPAWSHHMALDIVL